MKISEVTTEYVINYLRIDGATDVERQEIGAMMAAAKSYILHYTGLTEEELDQYEDLTSAYLVLIADNFDNRNLQTDKPIYLNKHVQSILVLHLRNLL